MDSLFLRLGLHFYDGWTVSYLKRRARTLWIESSITAMVVFGILLLLSLLVVETVKLYHRNPVAVTRGGLTALALLAVWWGVHLFMRRMITDVITLKELKDE